MKYAGENNKLENRKTPVVKSGVSIRKKNAATKLSDVFLEEDVDSVKSHVIKDILVPTTKKLFYDIITNSIGMILWGENGNYGGNNNSSTVPASRVSYSNYYNQNNTTARPASRIASTFDYDSLIFDSAGNAEMVLDAMIDNLSQGYTVAVGDFYDLAGVTVTNPQLYKYGWNDLRSARVMRVMDGWSIKLPRAIPID